MTYIRTFLVYFSAAIILVFAKPYLIYTKHLMKKDYEKGMNKLFFVARWVARYILRLSGVQLEVRGIENVPLNHGVLFVGNHQSNFDIVAVLASLPRPAGFIAKEEVRKIPFLSSWAEGIDSKFIPRGETRKSLEVVIETIKFLKTHNHGIVIFPEGTRSETGEVGHFKPGSLKIATKSSVSLVPFVVNGTANVMKKGDKLIYSNKIQVEFLPSYSPEVLKTMETVILAEELESQIRQRVQAL